MDNEKGVKRGVPSVREVFISDRMIVFQHMAIPLRADSQSILLSGGESSREVEQLINDLLNQSDHNQSLVIRTENTEDSWNTFLLNFDIVEAAGGLVIDQPGRLLMIHRYGKWDLPKGKLEPEEEVLQGAIREVIEECGVRVGPMIRPLDPSHHTYVHKGRKCLKRTHWFVFSGDGIPVPQEEEGIIAASWLSPLEVQEALNETYSSIRRVVTSAFPDLDFG